MYIRPSISGECKCSADIKYSAVRPFREISLRGTVDAVGARD